MIKTVFLLAGAMLLCGGCDPQFVIEQDARRIVEPAAAGGRIALAMAGSNEELVSKGRITKFGRVQVHDGTPIDYWVIKAGQPGKPSNRGTVVLIHPLLASKTWFLSLGGELSSRGWDVVLLDLRAHGRSGGSYTTWGFKEKRDIRSLMDHLLSFKDISPRIIAAGASLGGCVAIQYAAEDPRCAGVLSICPPMGARHVARLMMPLLSDEAIERRLHWAGRIADFEPDDASAIAAAKQLEVPLILVHGSWDLIVPYKASEALYNSARCPKKLIAARWSNHMSVQIGQDEWLADLIDQLDAMAGKG